MSCYPSHRDGCLHRCHDPGCVFAGDKDRGRLGCGSTVFLVELQVRSLVKQQYGISICICICKRFPYISFDRWILWLPGNSQFSDVSLGTILSQSVEIRDPSVADMTEAIDAFVVQLHVVDQTSVATALLHHVPTGLAIISIGEIMDHQDIAGAIIMSVFGEAGYSPAQIAEKISCYVSGQHVTARSRKSTSNCPTGQFESTPASPSTSSVCSNCSICPAGSYILVPCTDATDTLCRGLIVRYFPRIY